MFNEAHKKCAENKELAKGRAVIDQENRDPKEVDPNSAMICLTGVKSTPSVLRKAELAKSS